MRRKRWIASLLLLILLSLTGCGFKDIDKRFFVVAIGVDKGKDYRYKVTLKLAIPSPKIEPGSEDFQLVSREANSISEAVRIMKSDVDKEFDLGHAKVILMSKDIAQSAILETIDWMFRRRDIQRIAYLAIAEPSSEEILKTSPKSERLPANSLFLALGKEGTESSFLVPEFNYDFYNRLMELGKDPYLPIIRKKGNLFEINRVALFDKEKLRLVLSPDETRIFNQLVRKDSRFEIRVDEARFTLSIQEFTYKYKLNTPKEGKPSIVMDVRMKGLAEEAVGNLYDQDWKKLEEAAAKAVRKRYLRVLEKLKGHGLDPVGFGLRYMATHHDGEREYEDWKRLYPNIEFNIQVHVTIEGTGVIE
ncbi:Ger(x)C family spore germination protein [Paenibacillus sp. GD4]|uniref:Ger(x)C family spore germination protein n=1 Tax=Paenibacillus sp. GD4 TaxID=3068890 RepID=UPI0027966B24|nr:Ger(x)C family spore germination protein [Paenibacillus sp. GD4]MDQ1914481.1 Ger(x)C family spore germination protein [Paenibacillus sp. GD4]